MPASPRLAYLLLTLTSLFWAGNFVLARAMHAAIPPMTLSFMRWAVALVLLAPFALGTAWRQRTLLRQYWKRLCLLGAIGICGFNSLAYAGLQYTAATNAVLMNSFIPILILLLGRLFWRQPLSANQLVGIAISFIGVTIILCRGDWARLQALSFNQGDLLLFAAALDWALYTLILRGLDSRVDRLGMLMALILVGLACCAPLFVAELLAGKRTALTPGNLATFAYVGIFPSVLAYLFYNRGVAEVGAARAGSFIHLMPVFGTLLSIVFLNESFEGFHAAGIAAIFAGLWWSGRQRAQN
ncbi:DMT family transporter [Parachitinimonas caeni]|uniref:DMT family transporter n=1 Tax=Parachitinimonas caeni TaxID=3031301 RepID=A0ABT7DU87_9NEIS|nr:DMT family transporter [Parachitinimonas caeni]MDK2123636.1 DMT family transporter [Parachitinimonas caeni]